ncbi:MAG: hypothetical protein QME74_10380 [Candidatus Edwardsbacteria bacterium]|nr:hypothetical protein [Candidatus Edwardsbacteria bacterium]
MCRSGCGTTTPSADGEQDAVRNYLQNEKNPSDIYLLLLAFGLFLIVRGYQHVRLGPSLIGLFLVIALLLFAFFRFAVFRALPGPERRPCWNSTTAL